MTATRRKRVRRSLICIFLFFSISWATMASANEGNVSEEYPKLPLMISDYYHDLNFVVSYSTPFERWGLRRIRDAQSLTCLPQRLKKIGIMLRRLDDRILDRDRGIRMGPDKGPRYRPLPPPQLIQIMDMRYFGQQVMVRVITRPLSPFENGRLISEYEGAGMKEIFSLPAIRKRGFKNIPRFEIHRWVQLNDIWLKNSVNIVFINN